MRKITGRKTDATFPFTLLSLQKTSSGVILTVQLLFFDLECLHDERAKRVHFLMSRQDWNHPAILYRSKASLDKNSFS